MAEGGSSSSYHHPQANPGLGNQDLFGNIALSVESFQPFQPVNDQPGISDIVCSPLVRSFLPLNWQNRETFIQAVQGKSCEEIKEQIRDELKAEFEQTKREALEKDEKLKKVTAEKDTTMKALDVVLKDVESIKAELKDKNDALAAKDTEVEKLKKELKEKDDVIESLTKEKRELEKAIEKQNDQIEALNRAVSSMQNQHSSDIDQFKIMMRENEEKTESVDRKLTEFVKKFESHLSVSVANVSLQTIPSTVPPHIPPISKVSSDSKSLPPDSKNRSQTVTFSSDQLDS